MSFPSVKSLLGILIFLSASLFGYTQDRALGIWKSFMPYGSSFGVFDAGDKVYSASQKSLFSYNKTSGEIQTYDKSSGLSDVGIKTGAYDPNTKILVIGYNNNNLDLIYDGTDIYNIADIKNEATSGAVGINSVSFHDGNAYISSDLGISVLNLAKKEISNTYIIGSTGAQTKVFATSIDGTNIYAATAEGVKYAPLSSSNLQNFNSWTLFNSTQNLSTKKFTSIAAYNNKVYAVSAGMGAAHDTIYEFDGAQWQTISSQQLDQNDTVITMAVTNNILYLSTWYESNSTGKNGKIDSSGILSLHATQGHIRPINWFESQSVSWEADVWNGLFKNNQGTIEKIIPDGPASSAAFDLTVSEGTLYVAPGGVDDSWGFTWNGDGYFILHNDRWELTNRYNFPPMSDYFDILCTTTNAQTDKIYFGSFLAGLIEIDNKTGSINLYDKWNSLLEGASGDTQRTKISALATDKDGNIWIGNSGATKPIKMIQPDGTWREYFLPFSISLMKKILIDKNGQLWAPIRRSGEGLLVWSNKGTPDDPSDDVSRILSKGENQGGLPDPICFSIAEDKEGNIWAGTSQGIAIFYCPGSVLTANGCDADQIKVERDGYIGYLFGAESVRAIAVDAANRKWIGTTNGVWLISADGKKELLRFNVENSPLPHNQITDIAIDDQSGEVFIGTLGGLVSYQGDAMAECKDCDEAVVYPNPVKPDYSGPIAIKGLVENAYVKITDVSGLLVYQGSANGTQMIWDGKGYNGIRVKSGVYLVFSSTELGKEKRVAKLLLTN
jgi:hypothetical protein